MILISCIETKIKAMPNSKFAIGGVSYSADSSVVAESSGLSINPDNYRDGENRHFRQARNR